MASDYRRILEENLREYGEGTSHLEIYRTLYAERAHFLYELLQNAEDAGATKVHFKLTEDHLRVDHDGRLFDEDDVRSLCSIGQSTKEDDYTQIGRFGFGFKSVYAYTDAPEVHSGDEHLRIRNFIRPESAAPVDVPKTLTTTFLLPFNRDSVPPGEAFDTITEGLQLMAPTTLLFLQHIQSVKWTTPNTYTTISRRRIGRKAGLPTTTISRQSGNERSIQDWLILDREVGAPDQDSVLKVQIAFSLTRGEAPRIAPVTDPRLFVFFETAFATQPGFLIQGPFQTTPARDNIPFHEPWNKKLVHEAGLLLKDSLADLRDHGYLEPRFFDCLPMQDSDPTTDPLDSELFTATCDALASEPLLPTKKGAFSTAGEGVTARSEELVGMLSDRQLARLLDDESKRWLHPHLSHGVTAFLKRALDVQEITIPDFIQLLDEEFLKEMSDPWIRRFLEFFNDRRTHWGQSDQTSAPLRDVPFVRLEDGSQVTAFREDGSPGAWLPSDEETAFPTVKKEVISSKSSRSFLEFIGLSPADVAAEVIEIILPMYSKAEEISRAEHKRHLSSIRKSLETDSMAKRENLIKQLERTPWCAGENAKDGVESFRRPSEMYLPTPHLETAFRGVADIWFLTESRRGWDWEELGVSPGLRRKKVRSSLTGPRKLELAGGYFTRVEGEDDYDIEGLGVCLKAIAASPRQRSTEMAAAIWSLLVEHLHSLPEWEQRKFFEGEFRYFYYSSHRRAFPAKFTTRLRKAKWLPGPGGNLVAPQRLSIDDLPQGFEPNPILEEALGMRSSLVAQIAIEAGLDPDDLAFIRNHPEEFENFKRKLLEQLEEDPEPEVQPSMAVEISDAPPMGPASSSSAEQEDGGSASQHAQGGKGGASTSGLPEDGRTPLPSDAPSEAEPQGPNGYPGNLGNPPEGHQQRSDRNRQDRLVSYVSLTEDESDPGMSHEQRIAIEDAALQIVIEYETAAGRVPDRMPVGNPGFDIKSMDPKSGSTRYIEVKGTGTWTARGVTLSAKQFEVAGEERENYWLYVVELEAPGSRVHAIQNPRSRITSYAFDHGWKSGADQGAT